MLIDSKAGGKEEGDGDDDAYECKISQMLQKAVSYKKACRLGVRQQPAVGWGKTGICRTHLWLAVLAF